MSTTAAPSPLLRATTTDRGRASVFERVARERIEAHEPPEARGSRRDEVRMLVARPAEDGTTAITHAQASDLPDHLRAGDMLVVNTSATLPAALPVRRGDGTQLRMHLSTPAPGDGGWVVELRRDGERYGGGRAGETLELPGAASATLRAPYLASGQPGPWPAQLRTSARGPTGAADARTSPAGAVRLWLASIDTGATSMHDYLARHGAPIRYAHTTGEPPLAAYQTAFALHPGSAEMPSAGRPLTAELVTALVARGIVVAPITLHTGVSSLEAGERPYPERFNVPATTARLVNAARAGGGRVIAVGTTVVRALETVALPFGHVEADAGWTRHVVTPHGGARVVDGLLTGWHDPDGSHLLMLEAIAGRVLVEDSYEAALDGGYRWHEFGDVHLVLPPDS